MSRRLARPGGGVDLDRVHRLGAGIVVAERQHGVVAPAVREPALPAGGQALELDRAVEGDHPRGVAVQDVERVARAEGEERALSAPERVHVLDLVVVEDRRDGEAVRHDRLQHLVDPAAAHRGEEAAVAHRPLDHRRAVVEIDVAGAVPLVLGVARVNLHRAAHRVAVVGGEVSGKEIEARDDVGVDDGGERQEVKQERDLDPVHVDDGVLRRRAAHDEQPQAERRARDAGEVLDHLEHVALRARDGGELLDRDLVDGDLLALARPAHHRLEGAVAPCGSSGTPPPSPCPPR